MASSAEGSKDRGASELKMPPRGWRKGKPPEPAPKPEKTPPPKPGEEVKTPDPDPPTPEDDTGSDMGPIPAQKPLTEGEFAPVGTVVPVSAPPPSPTPVNDDMPEIPSTLNDRVRDSDAPFVTPKDVTGVVPSIAATPGTRGFIAEAVAASGHQLHDVEYKLTGHPIFAHTEPKERLWLALGKAIEAELDVSKYGIIILAVLVLGSELACVGVFMNDRRKAQARNAPNKKGKVQE